MKYTARTKTPPPSLGEVWVGVTAAARVAPHVDAVAGAEQDVVHAVEVEAAHRRLVRPEQRRVGVEHLEIVERPLLEPF